jgi:signal transduction histidine kinase
MGPAARILPGLVWMLALWLGASASVRAEPLAFDAALLRSRIDLAPHTEVLRDEGHALGLDDVSRGSGYGRFAPSRGVVSYGLDDAALWLRFAFVNSAPTSKRVLLELAYPHIDYLTVYALHEDGRVETTTTGDMLPFSERPIAVPNFLVPLELRAGERIRLYIRCATTGTLTLPLTAWEPTYYLEHLRIESVAQWLFCGAIVMMALYNLAVFTLIRRAEYLTQAFQLVCICAATLAFRGEVFALFLPNRPDLANKAISFFIVLCLAACALTSARVSASAGDYPWLTRPLDRAALLAGLVAGLIPFVSTPVAVRLNLGMTLGYLVAGGALLGFLTLRPPRDARLYVYSWYFPAVGVGITILASVGVLPDQPLLLNAGYVGGALQAVLTSLGLAARVKVMGDHLGALNGELSRNVVRLEQALEDARLANTLAQEATRAKDEFLATMSHELRTPLNAIINVPQGLLDDFVDERTASCSHCNSVFVLEPGESLHDGTCCPDCGTTGALSAGKRVAYEGDPAHTSRFLRKIERAGQHLLELVDRVLDFSKMEAGRFELTRERADLATMIRDAADAMGMAASERGIELTVGVPEGEVIRSFDRVRLRQVLLNLLSNAIKFTEDGGRVSIALSADDAHDADLVCVTDNGIGIAPDDHERIFVGFEQVHRKKHQRYGGTGLGLPISRNLIRLHGGELWVESTLGRGARFAVRLPRAPAGDATEPTRPMAVSRRPRSSSAPHAAE